MTTKTTVESMIEQVEEVLRRTLDRGGLGPLPASLLGEALEAARALTEQLVELQRFVVLEQDHRDEIDMQSARRLWDIMDSGAHRSDLDGLVAASPTLSVLRRAAVDIEAVHRFSREEIALATAIAESVGPYTHYVGQIAGRGSSKHDTFAVKLEATESVRHLLEELTRAGAIEGFKISARVEIKDRKPFWKPLDLVLGKKWRFSAVSVRRGTVASEHRPFLEGHWLTAYAYGIALDQFQRTGVAFEIYSNVEYRLPADLGGGRSDIDVLVRTADVLLCIECKTGKVLATYAGSESAAEKSLRSAERLDRLLGTMGVELDRTYQLVYLAAADQEESAVRAAVAGGEVPLEVMAPSAIRTMVRMSPTGCRACERQPLAGVGWSRERLGHRRRATASSTSLGARDAQQQE